MGRAQAAVQEEADRPELPAPPMAHRLVTHLQLSHTVFCWSPTWLTHEQGGTA